MPACWIGVVQKGAIAHLSALLGVAVLVFAVAHAQAGDIEPRTYVNTPVGVNFLIAGYAYSEGGVSFPAAVPIEGAEIKIDTGILGYARSLDAWGNSGKFDVIVPYSDLSGSALVAGEPQERKVSGLLDPRFRFSVNFYGSPALSVKEFADYQQDLLIGASVQVSVPAGRYDPSRLVNLGNNRWFIKPDIGISKAFGPLTLEGTAGVTFFSDNDDYFGGRTLEQDPLYSTQLSATYSFGNGVWFALGGSYDYGGRTTIDGVRSDNVQSNSRWGGALALPVNRNNSIKFNASTGVSTRTGSDYNLYGAYWQYRWGDGL
jgi:hypothetical protein